MVKKFLLFAFIVSCFSSNVLAQPNQATASNTHMHHDAISDDTENTPPPSEYDLWKKGNSIHEQTGRSVWSQGIRTLIVLFVIIALIYLSLRILRKYMGKGVMKGSHHISIVSRSYLDTKRMIYIIKVAQRYFLVGSAESGVSLISELNPEDIDSEIQQSAPHEEQKPVNFARFLFKKDKD